MPLLSDLSQKESGSHHTATDANTFVPNERKWTSSPKNNLHSSFLFNCTHASYKIKNRICDDLVPISFCIVFVLLLLLWSLSPCCCYGGDGSSNGCGGGGGG